MNIVLTICTRQRHEMFRDCLASVIAEPIPDSLAFAVVVVENDETRDCATIVEEIGACAPFLLHYVHEPRLGIPIARNRAVETALDLGAEWIGFIDDDEQLKPGWLSAMTEAIGTLDADVVQGEVRARPGGPSPDWLPEHISNPYETGKRLIYAATNNTLVRAALFRADGLGLRFDENLRFTGGSDTDFFLRARQKGARIVWTAAAPVIETWPAHRLRLRWHLYRAYSSMAARSRIDIKLNGRFAASRHLPKGFLLIIRGTAHLLAAGLMLAVSRRRGRAMGFRGLFMICKGAGRFAGLAAIKAQPYKQVEG